MIFVAVMNFSPSRSLLKKVFEVAFSVGLRVNEANRSGYHHWKLTSEG
jgi:hypothetical protein